MIKYFKPLPLLHRTEIEIEKSRFITSISCANDTEQAKVFVHQIRAEMPNANHHVYSFRVGFGNSVIEGMSDDGEPSGTAGPPTLAVLRGTGLGDIVAVTTRYFGGKKLGTGGLVRAYTESVKEALKDLKTQQNIAKRQLMMQFPYSFFNLLKKHILEHTGEIIEEAFTENILVVAEFEEDKVEAFISSTVNLTNGIVKPEYF
jgi:uncharacterized YigZ family protein